MVHAAPVHVRCWPHCLARTAPWHTRSRHTKLQSTRCSTRTHASTAVRWTITTRSTSPPLSTPVTAPRGEPFQSNCGIQTSLRHYCVALMPILSYSYTAFANAAWIGIKNGPRPQGCPLTNLGGHDVGAGGCLPGGQGHSDEPLQVP